MSNQVPFFEYPRLWLDEKDKMLSIIDKVASSGGFTNAKSCF